MVSVLTATSQVGRCLDSDENKVIVDTSLQNKSFSFVVGVFM